MSGKDVEIKLSLKDKATANINRVKGSIEKLANKSSGASLKIKKLAKSLSLLAVAAGVGKAFKGMSDLEKAMTRVQRVTGLTDKGIAGLQNELLELYRTTPQSLASLSDGLYDLVSAGVPADKAIKALKASSDLATVGTTTAKIAVDGLTSAINAYGLTYDDIEAVSDIFLKTEHLGKTTIEEFSKEIGNIAPIASSAGVGLQTVGAAMATLTANGQRTNIATTNLTQAIVSLGTEDEKIISQAREYGVELGRNALEQNGLQETIRQLVVAQQEHGVSITQLIGNNQEARKAVEGLVNSYDTFETNLQGMKNSLGEVANANKLVSDDIDTKFKVAINRVNVVMLKLVENFKAVVIALFNIYDNLKPAISKFEGLVTIGRRVIRTFTKLAFLLGKEVKENLEGLKDHLDEKGITEKAKRIGKSIKDEIVESYKEVEEHADKEFSAQGGEEATQKALNKFKELSTAKVEAQTAVAENQIGLDKKVAKNTETITVATTKLTDEQMKRRADASAFANNVINKGLINGTIDTALAQLQAWALVEIAKMKLSSFGTFGASLLAIAPIIAIRQALSGQLQSLKLQEGGIINPNNGGRGQLATIGEAGQPEAVVPLDSYRAGSLGGSSQPIMVNLKVDGKKIAEAVFRNERNVRDRGIV